MGDKTIGFSVLSVGLRPPASSFKAFLISDNWDDWFEFSTLFGLVVADEEGVQHDIGGVKIGRFKMAKNERTPKVPKEFERLPDSFFSLGQDDTYYENLNNLGDELRQIILGALRDVAADQELFRRALKEPVTTTSLLRSVTPASVTGQYKRLAQGGARLSRYVFSYRGPKPAGTKQQPAVLSFEIKPESYPPTNIHVLIGRNGVGKTRLLNQMARALLENEAMPGQFGFFTSEDLPDSQSIFANLVSVNFSAFDDFEPLAEQKESDGIRYSYVGLKRTSATDPGLGTPKSPAMLAREFVRSLKAFTQAKAVRWRKAVNLLEADPVFKEADIDALVNERDSTEFDKGAGTLFGKLSSGHKIVLLTITRLVETVEERTLVLLDEPEAHLHPPLLSAFVRSLSELLINRNGVAIIATHSPVVLQEVPRSCAWKLRRTGQQAAAERPDVETFAENVGVLTREVFGLEVTQSGFHELLRGALGQHSFEEAMNVFNDELGMEGRAIIRALIGARDAETAG